WASIVASAILIRSIQLPLSIYLFKSHLKFEDTSPAEKQARTKELKKMEVTVIYPYFEQCDRFCFVILNMAENVLSFKEGGALWITDLSTPDTMFIPILTALTIWIKIQFIDLTSDLVICSATECLSDDTYASTLTVSELSIGIFRDSITKFRSRLLL
ncbi:hypothetical protein MIMGU_mgv11b016027mg, partial [Erythranthe guttata]